MKQGSRKVQVTVAENAGEAEPSQMEPLSALDSLNFCVPAVHNFLPSLWISVSLLFTTFYHLFEFLCPCCSQLSTISLNFCVPAVHNFLPSLCQKQDAAIINTKTRNKVHVFWLTNTSEGMQSRCRSRRRSGARCSYSHRQKKLSPNITLWTQATVQEGMFMWSLLQPPT